MATSLETYRTLVRPRSLPTEPVQAVILAAGRGSRLEHLSRATPKCLVEVGGKTLLEHQLDTLAGLGVSDITIVTGYRAAQVREVAGGRARFVANDAWDGTNSLYSMTLCQSRVRGELLVMNCDVLAHPLALRRLMEAGPNAFLYDSASGDAEEDMKVELRHGRLAAMSKSLPAHRTDGENVGILRFDAGAARMLFRQAEALLAQGRRDLWLAAAVERLAQTVPLRGVDIADLPWTEIDFPHDLERARSRIWPQIARSSAPQVRAAA